MLAIAKSNFIWITERCPPRKFGCHPFPASSRIHKEIREHDEIDTSILARACERATATAYKAVMKPKEGTILTVAKGASQKAAELAETTDDLDTFISEVIAYAQEVLSKTPEMLPVLKEAGVVDSGGQGLLEVLHGAYDAFLGKRD